MRYLTLLVVLAGSVGAQQDFAQDDPTALLLKVRSKVLQTVDRLPRYLCTETVDRATYQPEIDVAGRSCDYLAARRIKPDWKIREHTSDRLRLDVAISGNNEMYSWVGEDRFQDRSLSDLVSSGATTTGVFSGFLGSIFGTNAANFTYNGDVNVDGRALVEFGFRVSREKSTYRFGNKLINAIVPYDGTFLVDPVTFDLVRLTIHDDQIPDGLNSCESTTTLEYGSLQINGFEFLIPKNAGWRVVNADGGELISRLVFSTCHEFLGKSKVRFDDASDAESNAAPPAVLGAPSSGVGIPPGLHFTLALSNPIDTATAAAGDPFNATLTSAIKTKQNKVWVPKGAAITGRVMRIERVYEPKAESLVLAIKLETIEAGGVPQPFDAQLASVVKRRQKPLDALVVRKDLGSFDQMAEAADAATGVLRFQDVTRDFVIKRGLEIEGRTGSVQ